MIQAIIYWGYNYRIFTFGAVFTPQFTWLWQLNDPHLFFFFLGFVLKQQTKRNHCKFFMNLSSFFLQQNKLGICTKKVLPFPTRHWGVWVYKTHLTKPPLFQCRFLSGGREKGKRIHFWIVQGRKGKMFWEILSAPKISCNKETTYSAQKCEDFPSLSFLLWLESIS